MGERRGGEVRAERAAQRAGQRGGKVRGEGKRRKRVGGREERNAATTGFRERLCVSQMPLVPGDCVMQGFSICRSVLF
ncbi:MAG: hypothetical protein AB9903_25235 [Vulcanimicrobiota bacterium]